MQDCLTQGRPLLIENVEEDLDPILDSVFNISQKRDGPNVVVIGEKEVSWLRRSKERSIPDCRAVRKPGLYSYIAG